MLLTLVIPRSPPFLVADDEESRIALKEPRARFLAEFTLSELRRFFAPLRRTREGLGMTRLTAFSHRPIRQTEQQTFFPTALPASKPASAL
jgi:hypothetical protein